MAPSVLHLERQADRHPGAAALRVGKRQGGRGSGTEPRAAPAYCRGQRPPGRDRRSPPGRRRSTSIRRSCRRGARGSRWRRRSHAARDRGAWRSPPAAAEAASAHAPPATSVLNVHRTRSRSPKRARLKSQVERQQLELGVEGHVGRRTHRDRRRSSSLSRHHPIGGVRIRVHELGDGVERVEEEVRLQLHVQQLETRLGEARFELVALAAPAVVSSACAAATIMKYRHSCSAIVLKSR